MFYMHLRGLAMGDGLCPVPEAPTVEDGNLYQHPRNYGNVDVARIKPLPTLSLINLCWDRLRNNIPRMSSS